MLRKYFEKTVKINFTDEDELTGKVITYTPAIDSEDNEDEIGIKCDRGNILVRESEIASIEIIEG